MQRCLKAVLLVGLAAAPNAAPGPAVQAADLGVTVNSRVMHHRRLVRDYDGTPIVVHVGRAVRSYDGTVVLRERFHQPVYGPEPLYYFTGEPVRDRYVRRRDYTLVIAPY